jgi:hypothetical protein
LTAPRSAPARPRFREQQAVEGWQVLEDSAFFSDEFCLFLQNWIPSVEAAEVLLALAGEPLPTVKPGDGDAQRYVKLFRAAGLVGAGADGAHFDAFQLTPK